MSRESIFPFAKTRVHEPVPAEVPDIDIDNVMKLNRTLKLLKRPVLDDLTGRYHFNPDRAGVRSYTKYYEFRDTIRQVFADKDALSIDVLLEVEARARKPIHLAETAEKAHGHFLAVAETRRRMLETALVQINDEQQISHPSVAVFCGDAIEDLGYCLTYPKNLPKPHEIDSKYSLDFAQRVHGFGAFVVGRDASVLTSADGVVMMQFAHEEQERRVDYHSLHLNAITAEYGKQAPDYHMSANPTIDELLALTSLEAA